MEGVHTTRRREDRSGARELVLWSYPLIAFAAVAVLLVAYLCQYAQTVGCQYALVDLRQEQKLLLQEKAELELAVQELTSLERVERLAGSKLGMIRPESRLCLDLTVANSGAAEVASTAGPKPR